MKKLVYIIPLVIFSLLSVAPVFAQSPTKPPEARDIGGWLKIVVTITTWIYTIILSLSVVMVLMAAFSYLTAGGDQAKVKKASQMLIYAVVGIVVAILAFSISKIVIGIVGV